MTKAIQPSWSWLTYFKINVFPTNRSNDYIHCKYGIKGPAQLGLITDSDIRLPNARNISLAVSGALVLTHELWGD